ncbi:hydantoinase B/oxoprolinase family protein [Parapusillimonas sp. SGNA-6]|nr:hydantoinase B/oxoprolinase family protein [Parapusillimonas sp. SGNA-6]
MSIDPITLAVMRGNLEQIADDMDTVLGASAISSIIADAWDLASGVFHPDTGEVIAQGPNGLPIFIVVMQHTVQQVLAAFPPETMKPGDVFIVNDPYSGGTHTMDVKLVKPYFRNGKLTMLVGNTGHWPDVGGMTPGGFTPASTDVYQEGFRMPPVRLMSEGAMNDDLLRVMLMNMRSADDRRGDLAAQINSLDVGCAGLERLFDQYPESTIFACVDELKQRSEQLMRDCIEQLPDGTYSFEDTFDNDGVVDQPLKISLEITIHGSEMTFDVSKSSSECRGPFNCPLSSTISALLIGMKHIFPDIPVNSGCFAPFQFVIPEGNMYNPRPPKPVSATTTETAQRLIGAVLGALAPIAPQSIPAGTFCTGTNIGIGGTSPTRGQFVNMFFFGGGYGGSASCDGLTNGSTLVSTARNTSIEVLEHATPLLFTQYAIREGSAGAGKHRGGYGVEVAFQLRDGEAYLTLVGDRGTTSPHGLFGGEPGLPADHHFHVGGKSFKAPFLTKIDRLYVQQGDGVVLRTPGGGGYGDPALRDAALIEQDAMNELEKPAAA